MSLADIIRAGVATAHRLTDGGELQEQVTLRRWTGDDDTAKPTYAATLTLKALVERRTRRLRTRTGGETVARATVTFLAPIKKLATTTGRREPVDPRDIVTLQDGVTGPIIDTDDVIMDQATERPFLVQVFLG